MPFTPQVGPISDFKVLISSKTWNKCAFGQIATRIGTIDRTHFVNEAVKPVYQKHTRFLVIRGAAED
ncbi:hypothetical protein RJ639_013153 [Escallonia herrerae]|uniref:Uncharacterized protein n=1 Tax=Escallonia herrerae TaxID=1293975 RepID=A0AA89ANS5_9ASTE|nr:hypothetical protein RJ639_013153 [Escallonia herrerae]